MKQQKNSQGFTLVEMIVVLIIIAIMATILVPTFSRWIKKSSQEACELCRADIVRHYHNVQLLENAEGREVKLSDVLAGDYDLVAGDIANDKCPSGGTYIADDENGTITCSYHDDDPGGDDPGGDDPGGDDPGGDDPGGDDPGGDDDYFYILGNTAYRAATWGDIEQFDPTHGDEPGMIIPTGTVFYYRGDYFLFRDGQYLSTYTDIPTYVAGYGVKINNTVFTTPSASSQAGDLKLVNGKVYVFFPYASRYYHDYETESLWYEITLTP